MAHFNINAKTGAITTAVRLDRETTDSYKLTAVARDAGDKRATFFDEAIVTITVRDYNDNPPIPSQELYMAQIREDAADGTEVLTVIATDKDLFKAGTITYSIIAVAIDGIMAGSAPFKINNQDGTITVNGNLDYETARHYTLLILLEDNGTPKLINKCAVEVTILDINDNAPVFDRFAYEFVILESEGVGAHVGVLNAFDADQDGNATVEYRIQNTSGPFALQLTTGKLTLTGPVDRETVSEYTFVVEASDAGGRHITEVNVTVIIEDVNDNTPAFTETAYFFVTEENKIADNFLTVKATDKDAGANAELTFSILESAGSSNFEIKKSMLSPNWAHVSLTVPLDREYEGFNSNEVW